MPKSINQTQNYFLQKNIFTKKERKKYEKSKSRQSSQNNQINHSETFAGLGFTQISTNNLSKSSVKRYDNLLESRNSHKDIKSKASIQPQNINISKSNLIGNSNRKLNQPQITKDLFFKKKKEGKNRFTIKVNENKSRQRRSPTNQTMYSEDRNHMFKIKKKLDIEKDSDNHHNHNEMHKKIILKKKSSLSYEKNKKKKSVSNESTREMSNLKIKWESQKWPRIELELHFGSCVGQGSFAKVYDGLDKKSKIPVAIKVISKRRLKDDKRKKLVQKEIEIVSKMKHENIGEFHRMLEDHKRVKLLV